MNAQTEALGFDLRIWGSQFNAQWGAQRRSDYLLNPAIQKPLSIDFTSWPSIFDTGGPRREMGLDGLPLAEFVGRHAPFWESTLELITSAGLAAESAVLIQCIKCFDAIGASDTTPVADGFLPFGYDVNDNMYVSGLSNCKYSDEEMASLRHEFESVLNDHHLFSNWDDALRYAAKVSMLVPEHGDFMPHLLCIRGTDVLRVKGD